MFRGALLRSPVQSRAVRTILPAWSPSANSKIVMAVRRASSMSLEASSTAAPLAPSAAEAAQPSVLQMRRLFVHAAIPMLAFGIVDQTVLIYMGEIIDSTVGVRFGLPTLAAAAMGQVFSDTSGVLFGGTIESIALKTGLPLPALSAAQQRMSITRYVSTAGAAIGVICGCCIGMLNLLFIDFEAAEHAKREKHELEVMAFVMEQGRELIGCEHATLWALDEEQNQLWTNWSSTKKFYLRVACDKGVVGHCYQCGDVCNINMSTPLGREAAERASQEGHATWSSNLCVPVMRENRVVGVVQFLGSTRHFDENDEKLARMLASHVSVFKDYPMN